MTKITAVAPGDGCPRWDQFLQDVTGGDNELITFLQRMAGYALTGSTVEQALFFLHGLGANGKSTFLTTLSRILGDYSKAAMIETFVASRTEQHPTGIASLHGARLVTAVETEADRRWSESRIKQLTGGDPIAARFMHRDPFEFVPQFKLVIAGNHKPSIRNVDEAMRRRLHLVPFTVTIPPDQRDPNLGEKLKAEWSGILRWMIDGCLMWQERGLDPPKVVREATDAYFLAEDALAAWLDDKCDLSDPNSFETSSNLFASWAAWANAANEFVGTQKRLSQSLVDRGLELVHKRAGNGFIGVKLQGVASFSGKDLDR